MTKQDNRKIIDCFFIGHNEMDFVDYEKNLRETGPYSGAYRDLNLNFVWYDAKPFHASQLFNLFNNGDRQGEAIKPLNIMEPFSAAIAYLGSYLHKRGWSFDYINSFQEEKDILAKKLTEENIRTIAIITTLYVSVLPILEIVGFVRKYNGTAKIIIGGPFVATQVRVQEPEVLEYTFRTIDADFFVNSAQGETALVEILSALTRNQPLERINNIYYKKWQRVYGWSDGKGK